MKYHSQKFVVGLLCAVLLFSALLLNAHEPADMKISYNALSGVLKITVYHKVNSTSVHYIKSIKVFLNKQGIQLEERLIVEQNFFSQPNRNEQRAQYIINDLKPGDKLSVTADCNLFGTIEKEYTISESDWQKLANQ